MSINDFIKKIKGKFDIDTFTILCLFVIVGVGISSFGLGRLSMSENSNKNEDIIITNQPNFLNSQEEKILNNSNNITDVSKEKRYVASKSGKLYYPVSCSGAQRISEKNKIYFATSSDAEKSGFNFATSCNK